MTAWWLVALSVAIAWPNPADAQEPSVEELMARPAARQEYQAALQQGCSPFWAKTKALATTLPPNVAVMFVSARARSILENAISNARGGSVADRERAARQGLQDWRCGAATRDDNSLIALHSSLAILLEEQKRWPEAEAVRREALRIAETFPATEIKARREAVTQLAHHLEAQGRFAEAEALRSRVMAPPPAESAPLPAREAEAAAKLAEMHASRAQALEDKKRWREAEAERREALRIAETLYATGSPALGAALVKLSRNLEAQNRFLEADRVRSMALLAPAAGRVPLAPHGDADVEDYVNNSLRVADDVVRLFGSEIGEYAIFDALDRAADRNVPDDALTARILLELVTVLLDEERYELAEAMARRVLAIPALAQRQDYPTLNSARLALFNSLLDQHRRDEAGQIVDALRHYAASDDKLTKAFNTLTAKRALARWLEDCGRFQEAEQADRDFLLDLKSVDAQVNDLLSAPAAVQSDPDALSGLGPILAEERARQKAQLKTRFSSEFGDGVRVHLAALLERTGQFQEAEALRRDILTRTERYVGVRDGGPPEGLVEGKVARLSSDFEGYATQLDDLAKLLLKAGRPEEAVKLLRRSTLVRSEQVRAVTALQPILARQLSAAERATARLFIAAVAALPDGAATRDEVLAAVQRGMTGPVSDALVRASVRIAATREGREQEFETSEQVAEQLRRLDDANMHAVSHAGLSSYEDHVRLGQSRRESLIRWQELTATLTKQFPAWADLIAPTTVTLAELQGEADANGLLQPDEALVLVLHDNDAVYTFAVSRAEAAFVRLSIGPVELTSLVAELRCGLSRSLCGDSPRAGFSRAAAHRIYQAVFGDPRIAAILDGKPKLFTVLSGPLTALPPGLLVTAPPSGEDSDPIELRETPWLLRQKTVAVLPSVASLRSLRRGGSAGSGTTAFLGLAPEFDGGRRTVLRSPTAEVARAGGRAALLDQVRSLPALSGEQEIEAMRAALGAPENAVRIGQAATKGAVLTMERDRALQRPRVVAFATHGLVSGDFGLTEPALALTPPVSTSLAEDDGLLRASDIATFHLSADWVILSACNTAAGTTPEAEGLSGLARAFFFAGARALIVSHWPVRDDVAARLSVGTIRWVQAHPGATKAEALREATLDLMDDVSLDASSASFAHPSAWAPFILVGAD